MCDKNMYQYKICVEAQKDRTKPPSQFEKIHATNHRKTKDTTFGCSFWLLCEPSIDQKQ